MRFNDDENLDPGVHYMTLDKLTEEFGFSEKRRELIDSISKVAKILKDIGCPVLYIDGSFASSKLEPNDWDGCYECSKEYSNFFEMIREKEPVLLQFENNREKQQQKYQCDLFPHWFKADIFGRTYWEFFQQTREGEPKGIIAIKLNER